MLGIERVVSRLRRPSVLNASRVPIPGNSSSSGSESAGRVTSVAALDEARRAGVLLQHVGRRERRLVLPWPGADERQAPHVADEAIDLVETPRRPPRQEVAAARRDAAVHQRDQPLRPGHGVQAERVLREEGDVHHRPAELQHPPHGLEAHEPGHRADHEVCPGDRGRQCGRVCEVGDAGGRALKPRHPLQTPRVPVHRGDLEARLRRQVGDDRMSHQPTAQNDDPHRALPRVSWRPLAAWSAQ